MTAFNEFFRRYKSCRLCTWFIAVAFFYLLSTLISPQLLCAAPLSPSENEQFEFALEYLQQNSHTMEVEQFQNLLLKWTRQSDEF